METGCGFARFFFQDPVKGYGELTRLIRNRFRELHEDDPSGGRSAYRESAFKAIVRSAEVRFLLSVRIKSEFGLDANKLNLYEYYLLLEQMDKAIRSGGNSRNKH